MIVAAKAAAAVEKALVATATVTARTGRTVGKKMKKSDYK
jgi:hypothetical protein